LTFFIAALILSSSFVLVLVLVLNSYILLPISTAIAFLAPSLIPNIANIPEPQPIVIIYDDNDDDNDDDWYVLKSITIIY